MSNKFFNLRPDELMIFYFISIVCIAVGLGFFFESAGVGFITAGIGLIAPVVFAYLDSKFDKKEDNR